MRHGESLWNQNKTFTGWADPNLSERGVREVEHAARLLIEGGYKIDVAYTSRLKRAIRSTWILLSEMNLIYLPVFKSWRLNERMYGALTGLSKVCGTACVRACVRVCCVCVVSPMAAGSTIPPCPPLAPLAGGDREAARRRAGAGVARQPLHEAAAPRSHPRALAGP